MAKMASWWEADPLADEAAEWWQSDPLADAEAGDDRSILGHAFDRVGDFFTADRPAPPGEGLQRAAEVEQRAGQREAIRDSLIAQAPTAEPPARGMGVIEATRTAIGNVPDRWRQSGAGLRQGTAEARVAQIGRMIETFDSANLYGPKYNAEVAQQFEAFVEAQGHTIPDNQTERGRMLAGFADNLTPDERAAFRDFYAAQYEEMAGRAAADYRAAGERQTPVDTAPGSAAYYVSAIAGSLGEMGPAFLASFVTGNPLPAMAGIGLLVGGQSYGEGRAEGLSPEDAGDRALLMAAAEGIPEAIPLYVLLKPGSALFKRMAQAGIAEAGQEMITEALQIGIDTNYLKPDIRWGEVVQQIADAGIIGAGAGATLAVAAHGVQRAKGALPGEDPGKTIGREMGRQLADPSMAARIDAHLWNKGIDPTPRISAPPQPQAPFDPQAYVDKLIGAESGGRADAANPNSTAEGLGQFIDATWIQTVKDHAPEIAGQYTRGEILEMKIDTSPEGVEFQRKMVGAFSDDNAEAVRKAGFEVNDTNVYLFHHFGVVGGPKILRADPRTPVVDVLDEATVKANPFLKDMTAGDLIGWAGRKMSGEGAPMVAPGERVQPDMLGGPERTETEMAARETFEQRVAEVEAGEGDLFSLYMEYVADPENAEAAHGIERLEAQGVLGKGFVEAPDFKATFPLPVVAERAGEFDEAETAEDALENVRARFRDDGEVIGGALANFDTARKEGKLAVMTGMRDQIAATRDQLASIYGPEQADAFMDTLGAKVSRLNAEIRRATRPGAADEAGAAPAPTPAPTPGAPGTTAAAPGGIGAPPTGQSPEARAEMEADIAAVEAEGKAQRAATRAVIDALPEADSTIFDASAAVPGTIRGVNTAMGSIAAFRRGVLDELTDAELADIPGPARRMIYEKGRAWARAQIATAKPSAKKPRKPRVEGRPQSLLRWLADNGGLRDDQGELAALDAQLWHRSARDPGERGARPRLVRDDGRTISRAAEAAWEAGYIPDKEDNTLLDAIAREMGGERIVAGPDQADEQQWLDTQVEREAADEAARLIEAATEKVGEALTVEWGGLEMTRREIAAVAKDVADGADVDSAIEFWINQEIEDGEGRGDTAGQDDIPGFEAAGDEVAGDQGAPGRPRDRGAVEPDEARGQDDRREAGAPGEEVAATPRPTEDPGPDGGTQTVIPGAERITERELAERRMQEAKRARVAQRAPGEDGGLFDEGERDQGEMFLTDATGSEAFVDTPMPGHQPLYRNIGTPQRPANELIEIGDRTVKLSPMHKPTRREGIRYQVIEIIGSRVYAGKVKGKARLGFYRQENAEVRIRDFDDIEVLAHEMAHWLDFHGSNGGIFTAFRNDPRFKDQIEQFSYTTVKGKVNKEGFAEFTRLWFTRWHVAQAMAPEAVAEFERLLARRPKFNRMMRRLQDEMHKFFMQGATASGRAKIGSDLTPAEANMKLMQSAPLVRARAALIDRFHGIKVAERTIHGNVMPGAFSASKQMQLLGGAEGIFDAILRFGTPRMTEDGGLEFRGKPLNDVFWKIARMGNRAFDDAMHYFAARRAAELKAQGRENLFTAAEIEAGLALGNPTFEKAFDEFQTFNGEMLDFYVEMGLITEEQREAFQAMNANYVPFMRIVEALERGGKGRGRTIGARLLGGDRNIRDVAVNITESLFFNIRAALIARAKRTLFTDVMMSEAGAEFAARIGADSKKVRAEIGEMTTKVARILFDLGLTVAKDGMIGPGGDIEGEIIDVADIKANLAAHPELLEFWLHGQKPTTLETYIDSAVIGGKRVWFEVRDPALVDSLTHLGGLNISPWFKPLLWPANLIRRTVTSAVDFVGGNFARDTGSGFVLSRNFMLPVVGTLRGMTRALFQTKDFKLFMLNGGAYGTRVLANTEETRARRQLDAQRSSAINKALRGLAFWDRLLSATEIGTRLEESRLALKRGKDTIEATWEGRDVTVDFSKRGSVEVVAILIRTVPFMQPAIQGIDKFARAMFEIRGKMTLLNLAKFDRNKARVFAMGSILAAATAAVWLWNDLDDDRRARYNALTDYERSRYWYLFDVPHVGDVRIPKPFDVGVIFATAPEVALDYFARSELHGGGDAVHARRVLAFAMANNFMAGDYPGVLQGWIRSKANETFTGAPIIPEWLRDAPPDMQFRTSTPEVYRMYADSVVGQAVGASPLKTRFYMRTYLTYFAGMGEDIAEAMLWDSEKWGERPFARGVMDHVLHHFRVRPMSFRTRWTVGYYDLRRRANGLANGIRNLEADVVRDPSRYERALASGVNQTLLALAPMFAEIDAALRAMPGLVRAIKFDPTKTAAVKEREIEVLYADKNDALFTFYKAAETAIVKAERKMAR